MKDCSSNEREKEHSLSFYEFKELIVKEHTRIFSLLRLVRGKVDVAIRDDLLRFVDGVTNAQNEYELEGVLHKATIWLPLFVTFNKKFPCYIERREHTFH